MRGIAHDTAGIFTLIIHPRDLWKELCCIENLNLAYKKARKHKTLKSYVLEFEERLEENLLLLQTELFLHSYSPKRLETFILRDPKTRKISKSDFRDRIIHHALCNILEPFFEKVFIYDSYANRKGKGTLKAIQRFVSFQKKISKNNTSQVFILKSDIRHYFDEVDHAILLKIIKKKMRDKRILWLVQKILNNYLTKNGKGMPLGNLTSQFFANVYLNELDMFVKNVLKAKYYIRYVDDFVLLHTSREHLYNWRINIETFLREKLLLGLHPQKTKILCSSSGIGFLGLKVFPHYRILKKRNVRLLKRKIILLHEEYKSKKLVYDEIYDVLEGSIAYAKIAHTYNLRKKILNIVEYLFPGEISAKEFGRLQKTMDTI